jgi:hypothetical protein
MKTVMVVVLFLTFASTPAWAVLGEYANSVASDQQVMHGEVRAIARQGYSVQEIKSGEQTVVREYVSPSGLVFGVAWHGPAMPNLQQLLGSYFAEFQQMRGVYDAGSSQTVRSNVRRRGPIVVRTDKLVVESGGHMRSFHGRAYAPRLFPQNITPEVVQ